MLTAIGFTDVKVSLAPESAQYIKDWMPGSGCEKYVSAAYITATKPHTGVIIPGTPRTTAAGAIMTGTYLAKKALVGDVINLA